MTKQGFARQVGTSRMALDLIEKGQRVPGIDLATRIARAGDLELGWTAIEVSPTVATTLAGHATALDVDDPVWCWRWLTSDFVANQWVPATARQRTAMLADQPDPTGDARWDSFLQALAEHLAARSGIDVPGWVATEAVEHGPFWWPVHGGLPSTRAAAMAHSPASFARRGILIDGRELPRVLP